MEQSGGKSSLAVAAVLCLFALLPAPVRSQDDAEEARFADESLKHRTALHYDPLLDAPIEALLKLYASAERTEELLGLYRNHVAQYPEDAGAKTVLVRLLRRIDRARAEELIATVVPQHPEFAPLQFLLYRFLEERGDPRAAETLSRAIDLEDDPARRGEWLDQLLLLSEGEAARTLAEAQIAKVLATENLPLDTLVGLARQLQRHRFWEGSVTALTRAKALKPAPDTGIEVEIMLATAFSQLGRQAEAGRILDDLLSRLAPDHWRRRELLSLRLGLVAGETERLALLKALAEASERDPRSESAALDYAAALAASESREEAIEVLLRASEAIPKSQLIENRTLELLETAGDREKLAAYLEGRLEDDPSRLDLRFRLVKVQYALGRDAAAEQDFLAVVAGLSPEESSQRILELQRYLREIERPEAAVPYLERFLRQYPTRLDVARELVEVCNSTGKGHLVGEIVRALSPEEADTENLIDFAEYLLETGHAAAARGIVEAKLANDPRQFELGLLLIEILGATGDGTSAAQRIGVLREGADTPPRYASWLEAAISAHRRLESLPGFLESELNRYDFNEIDWTDEKVERFLILCEAGRRELFAGRVADGLRRQLAQGTITPALRLRLRKMLVAVLENDVAAAAEVEEQLGQLAAEDPAGRAEYDLRRVLIYHRSQRADLARELVTKVPMEEVGSATLLREASDAMVEYGLLSVAEEAMETYNKLEPGDYLGWERRLSLLASLGEEESLRGVIRALSDRESGLPLREDSIRALQDHLNASYWRSIAALIEAGDDRLEAVPSLLSAVEREEIPESARLWVEWTRARVFARLGRSAESGEALERLRRRARAEGLADIAFPDGLLLSVEAAADSVAPRQGDPADPGRGASTDGLVANPVLRWVFEVPEGARVQRLAATGERLLLLDDQAGVHCLDAASGKLLWRNRFGKGGAGTGMRPAVFDAVPAPPTLRSRERETTVSVKLAPSLAVTEKLFFLAEDGHLVARSVADGALAWSAALPSASKVEPGPAAGASPGVTFERADGILVVYGSDAREILGIAEEGGKVLWSTPLGDPGEPGGGEVVSLNSGLHLGDGIGLAFGRDVVVFSLGDGKVMWRIRQQDAPSFPPALRPSRDGDESPAAVAASGVSGSPGLFPYEFRAYPGGQAPPPFFEAESALVSPAVHWAESRKAPGKPARAILAEGALWLMLGESVRRISSDLPLASRELPAGGAFVGNAGNHLWFLAAGELLHVDFQRDRTTRLPLPDLGDPAQIRATVLGNQVLARGGETLRLFNALSGAALGQATLPATLTEYLAAVPTGEADLDTTEVWHGRVERRYPGDSGWCLPVADSHAAGRYFLRFGPHVIACLEAGAGRGEEVPPAPANR